MDELLQLLMSNPELAQQVAGMGVYDDRQALLSDQMKRAQVMRNAQGEPGFMAGRVYAGAGPLDAIATGMERARGARDVRRLEGEQKGLVDQDVQARQGLAAAMAQAMKARQQAPQTLPPIPYRNPGE